MTTLRIGNIRIMLGVSFLQMLAFYSCVSALFLQSRGLNFTEILALESFVAAGIFLFEIPSGVWADRFGRRRLLVAANALAVVGMAIFATGHHFLFFALESFLGGIGIACASGADQALIYDSLQAEGREGEARGVFGRLSAAGTVGHLVAYPLGGLLASYSLTLPVYVTLISSVLALLLVLQLEEPPRAPLEGHGDVEDAGGATAQSSTGTWVASWQGLKVILGRRRLLAFSLATGAVWTLYHNLYYLNQPVFARGGLPIVYFGLAAAAMSGSRLLALKVDSFAVRLGEGGVVRWSGRCRLPGLEPDPALAPGNAADVPDFRIHRSAGTNSRRRPHQVSAQRGTGHPGLGPVHAQQLGGSRDEASNRSAYRLFPDGGLGGFGPDSPGCPCGGFHGPGSRGHPGAG